MVLLNHRSFCLALLGCRCPLIAPCAWLALLPVILCRCIRMAIVHDVAESIVGDITPHCKVSKEDKARMERDAIGQIQVRGTRPVK